MVKIIATKEEFDKLLKESGDKLVVVDFYADWCGPCKVIGPKIEEFEKQFTDVIFVKVNVDDNSDTSEAEGISAMPTFKFYKGGKKVDEVVGANESKVKAAVEKHK